LKPRNETFFFGRPAAPLFGVYHPPLSAADRDLGIVLCAPLGREYTKTHRAFRQLALRLSEAGFHVLRFDYSGCGDSAGEPVQADLARWAEDVGHAADELVDRAGVARVGLVGLRLGGTLALLAAVRRRDVEAVVLWEPVLEGRLYLAELMASNTKWEDDRGLPRQHPSGDGTLGILGFPMGRPLRESLESLDWTLERRPARRALLLRESREAMDETLLAQLERHGVQHAFHKTAPERFWQDADNGTRMFVPNASLEAVTEWLSGKRT
jgi:pimeloyl-ACP methyl ester carboxylesterase